VDSVDLKILRLLEKDARHALKKIAREVGLSKSGVRRRIQRLQNARIIKQYSVIIDPKKCGYHVLAFVTIGGEPKGLDELATALERRHEVCELHRTGGGDYLMVKIRSKDIDGLNKFIEEYINSSEYVKFTSTLIVMKTYKEVLLNP
jgi:Lrp/AsnC family leucine-responsive transcriptional regulator